MPTGNQGVEPNDGMPVYQPCTMPVPVTKKKKKAKNSKAKAKGRKDSKSSKTENGNITTYSIKMV